MTARLPLAAVLRLLLIEETDLVACHGTGSVPLALALEAVGQIPAVARCTDCSYDGDKRVEHCARHRGTNTPEAAARHAEMMRQRAAREATAIKLLREGHTQGQVRRQAHMGRDAVQALARRIGLSGSLVAMSPEKHAQILRLLSEGLSVSAIARRVGCDWSTVDKRRRERA